MFCVVPHAPPLKAADVLKGRVLRYLLSLAFAYKAIREVDVPCDYAAILAPVEVGAFGSHVSCCRCLVESHSHSFFKSSHSNIVAFDDFIPFDIIVIKSPKLFQELYRRVIISKVFGRAYSAALFFNRCFKVFHNLLNCYLLVGLARSQVTEYKGHRRFRCIFLRYAL